MTPSAKLKQLWDARIAEIVKERDDLTTRLAEAQEAARWLLYDAPGREYAEVQTMLKQWPWLGENGGTNG